MELELRRPKSATIPQRQSQAQLTNIPLGTADWHRFPPGANPTFSLGDIFVGRTLDGYPVGIKDQGHIGVIAKTRSGKGTDLIVPNLITWPGSIVAIDIKGENAILTARRRERGSLYTEGMGQRVHIIDPFGEVWTGDDDFANLKASFNPLDMLGVNKPESVDDAARIAGSAIDTEASVSDPFWNESARTLIQFVILHVASSDEFKQDERNLLTVRDLILQGYTELRSLLADNLDPGSMPTAYALLFRAMRKNPAFKGEVAKAGAKFARMEDNSPRMLESIAQVACTSLDFLASEAMQACVARSSFSLSDLKTDPRGVSLYLCLPQRFMETHYRFFRMMIALLIAEMERIRHQPRSGHSILMVLDEFAALKRMPTIEHAAAQIAGFGVKMMFVVQTLGQLKEVYKDNYEFMLGNCSTRIFFGNDDPLTRETVTKLIGDTETVRQTRSQSASHGSSNTRSFGESEGQSFSSTHGQSSSSSMGPQGSSFSSSASSSQTQGTNHSQSRNNAFGQNTSETAGFNEAIHKRPLVTPDEIGRYFGNADDPMALVLLSGQQPLAVRRIAYFKESYFAGKYDPHPDHPKPKILSEVRDDRTRREMNASLDRIAEEFRRKKAKQAAETAKRKEFYRQDRLKYQRWLRQQERELDERYDREEDLRWWKRIAAMVVLFPPVFITVMTSFHAYKQSKPIVAAIIETWSSLFGIG